MAEITMEKPTIKRENSPEHPLSNVPAEPRGAIATLFAASPAHHKGVDDSACSRPKYTPLRLPLRAYQDAELKSLPAKIKTELIDKEHVAAAVPAHAKDRKVQPQHGKFVGPCQVSGRYGAQELAPASWLSSRPALAPKQTPALTPTSNFLAKHFTPHSARPLINQHLLCEYKKHIQRVTSMDDFGFGGDGGLGGGQEVDFNDFGAYADMTDNQQMVTVPLLEFQTLQTEVHSQKDVNNHLFYLNSQLYERLTDINARVGRLEQTDPPVYPLSAPTIGVGAAVGTAFNAGGLLSGNEVNTAPSQNAVNPVNTISAKRPIAKAFSGEGTTMPARTKHRKKFQLLLPDKPAALATGAGMPTPLASAPQVPPSAMMASFPATPRTPYTPGKIGPPDSYKKTTTSINKRAIHNLDKSVPPQNVQLPMVPLTDGELVVYFFNSLCKPMVSLRLYARNWGPASITQCLNQHRDVRPTYLRNTASVKCTTAIKVGEKRYGPDWESQYRDIFATADDAKATDLIRADRVDEKPEVDYEIRALRANLKMHPGADLAGIFTECVKYCIENDAPYTMTNVYQLAEDLQNGVVPQHPAPPNRNAQSEDDEDESSDPPSPLAERSGLLGITGGTINFTAVNGQHGKEA